MNTTQTLIVAAGAQALLAVFTWWPRAATLDGPATALFPEDAAFSFIEVEREGADPVRVERKAGSWVLASHHDAPADEAKVDEVLDALRGITLRTAVATSAASHDALKVGEEDFGRKVRARAGDTEVSFTAGAAASKSVHIRLDGESTVYKVSGPSEWSFKDTPRSYLPTYLIDEDPKTLESFSLSNAKGRVEVVNQAGTWVPVGAPGFAVDGEALDKLLKKALQVRITEVAGRGDDPAWGLAEPVATVAWSVDDAGQSVPAGYAIGPEVSGKHAVRRDGDDLVIQSARYGLKDLLEADPEALLVDAPEQPPEAPDLSAE